jgi:hypothetical protein
VQLISKNFIPLSPKNKQTGNMILCPIDFNFTFFFSFQAMGMTKNFLIKKGLF